MKRPLMVVALIATTSLAIPIAGSAAAAETGGQSQETQIQQVRKLAKTGELETQVEDLATYISGEPGNQVLDIGRARASGASEIVVEVTEETVSANNYLVDEIMSGEKLEDVDLGSFPLVEEMMETTPSQGKTARNGEIPLAKAGVSACGDKKHPVPSKSPKRHKKTSSKPHTSLKKAGFHKTAGYACGARGYTCANDYTQGRGIKTKYGYCKSPTFRNQGYVTGKKSYWIQYGEPNPEIHKYPWPYKTWGLYVKWWHDKH
ncbi:hypothetical protein [Brevibacterium sp. ZH18]|uniref:hypothetical protein n=1 Tax=Brevibacterium sp. ZH18 TaxID=2927784 RepID=UPI001F621981|nr:hypothetical protein [Brevibacterium sp. ZH18]MCI4010780.1 hypothetical protein [Brevibacterium sp. ZH18]